MQYDRRVVFMQDTDRLNWQAETRQVMQTLAAVASQVRVPLSLVSSFVRQIGRQAADQAPRLADMAGRAVEQLGRVELTYNRVIGQVNRTVQLEPVNLDGVLGMILAGLPEDRRRAVQCQAEPTRPVWADRAQLADAVSAMLAYLLRIGDADAPISVRVRGFGDAMGLSMTKQAAGAPGAAPSTRAAGGPSAPDAADEALARFALDEPGLHQFAASHHGLFRRRRTVEGETLRLVLRTKEAPCTTA